jgi:DNA-binding transcriptional MerR regulator
MKYAIGKAAEKIGRSVDTLRDWDRRGLLPASRDSAGRRFYSDEDIARGRELVGQKDRIRGGRGETALAA